MLATSSLAEVRVLGKVGQSLSTFGIHRSPSASSHVYYEVQPYEYLVVSHTRNSRWLAVALNTGGYGYAPASGIAILPYSVRQTIHRPTYNLGSRGASGSWGASGVAAYATKFIGTPYKWGGEDLYGGIDCSAFVKKMFGQIGVNLPRTAAEQALVGTPINRLEELQPGDRLYFWEEKRHKIGHTGIYLGRGWFVHSSSGNHGVSTNQLTAGWIKLLCAARR
jgi:hypothetical protein